MKEASYFILSILPLVAFALIIICTLANFRFGNGFVHMVKYSPIHNDIEVRLIRGNAYNVRLVYPNDANIDPQTETSVYIYDSKSNLRHCEILQGLEILLQGEFLPNTLFKCTLRDIGNMPYQVTIQYNDEFGNTFSQKFITSTSTLTDPKIKTLNPFKWFAANFSNI